MTLSKGSVFQLSTVLIVGFIAIYLLAGPITTAQSDSMSRMVDECNADYGAEEWVAVPANASERGLFIGQMAVCVSEDSPRAADCDHAWIFGCDPPKRYDMVNGS